MKLLKKISLSMVLVLTIFSFYGCKSSSPSDFVKSDLDGLKGANDKIVSIMATALSGTSKEDAEYSKELIKLAQKVTYEITSEKVDKDTAVVYLNINGPDFEIILKDSMTQVAKVAIEQAISDNYMTEEEENKMIMSILIDCTKNAQFSDRTGKINLVKVKQGWQYANEDDIAKLIFNFDPSTFDYNNVDNYIDEDALYNTLNE